MRNTKPSSRLRPSRHQGTQTSSGCKKATWKGRTTDTGSWGGKNDTSLPPPQCGELPRRGWAGHSLHPQARRMEMCITLLPPLPGHLLSGRSHALCGWTQKPGCLACHNIPSNCKTQVTEERSRRQLPPHSSAARPEPLTPAYSFSNPGSSAV